MATALQEHVPTLNLTPGQKDALLRDADPEPLTTPTPTTTEPKLWRPRRVFITPDAFATPHGRNILERTEALGAQVVRLKSNQLRGLTTPVPKGAPPDS